MYTDIGYSIRTQKSRLRARLQLLTGKSQLSCIGWDGWIDFAGSNQIINIIIQRHPSSLLRVAYAVCILDRSRDNNASSNNSISFHSTWTLKNVLFYNLQFDLPISWIECNMLKVGFQRTD